MDMDDLALFGSEVFQNLANQELAKEAAEKKSEETILDEFLQLQERINSNAALKEQFKKIQTRMINDPNYRNANNEAFVRGVMLLKLGEE